MSTGSPPISVQLYSVRDQAAQDFERVLRRIGDIGFVGVEFAGFHDLTPAQYAAIVKDTGMVTSSAHLTDLSPDGFNAMLDNLEVIGCDVAVCAFMQRTPNWVRVTQHRAVQTLAKRLGPKIVVMR